MLTASQPVRRRLSQLSCYCFLPLPLLPLWLLSQVLISTLWDESLTWSIGVPGRGAFMASKNQRERALSFHVCLGNIISWYPARENSNCLRRQLIDMNNNLVSLEEKINYFYRKSFVKHWRSSCVRVQFLAFPLSPDMFFFSILLLFFPLAVHCVLWVKSVSEFVHLHLSSNLIRKSWQR